MSLEIEAWFCYTELAIYMGARDSPSTFDGAFFSLIHL